MLSLSKQKQYNNINIYKIDFIKKKVLLDSSIYYYIKKL